MSEYDLFSDHYEDAFDHLVEVSVEDLMRFKDRFDAKQRELEDGYAFSDYDVWLEDPVCFQLTSDIISKVRYSYATNEMDVQFANGEAYSYCQVPEYCFHKLLDATSPGLFYNHNIRDQFGGGEQSFGDFIQSASSSYLDTLIDDVLDEYDYQLYVQVNAFPDEATEAKLKSIGLLLASYGSTQTSRGRDNIVHSTKPYISTTDTNTTKEREYSDAPARTQEKGEGVKRQLRDARNLHNEAERIRDQLDSSTRETSRAMSIIRERQQKVNEDRGRIDKIGASIDQFFKRTKQAIDNYERQLLYLKRLHETVARNKELLDNERRTVENSMDILRRLRRKVDWTRSGVERIRDQNSRNIEEYVRNRRNIEAKVSALKRNLSVMFVAIVVAAILLLYIVFLYF